MARNIPVMATGEFRLHPSRGLTVFPTTSCPAPEILHQRLVLRQELLVIRIEISLTRHPFSLRQQVNNLRHRR